MKHLESLFERALDAVVGMDEKGMVIAWNDAAEEIFGWRRNEAIGASMGELIVPPKHREAHARGLQHYNRTGEGPVLEQRVRITGLHRDGHEIPIELSIFPMRDMDGPASFYAFIRSLLLEDAMRREQEARAEEGKALLAVAQKLLDDVSLDEFTEFCLSTVCSVTGMEAGHFQMVRGSGSAARLYPSNVWYLADKRFAPVVEATNGIHFHCGEGIPGKAWESGELQVVDDVSATPAFLRKKVFANVGLSRAVALPVWHGGEVQGVLEFFGTSRADLSDDFLRMTQTIGSQIGVAIRRKEHSEYRETLRREMSHRVRNSLAVLSSIYRSCSRTAKSKDELDNLYLNRLTAVARASQLTLDHAGHDAPLADLVHAAIEIFPDRSRIEVKVPHMAVQSDSVVPLALVLSELATNSVKHSDLGETSRISIRAHVDPATDELVLEWQEAGVRQPDVALSPTRKAGFGTTLIKAMIEDQLAGSFERKFNNGGLSVFIRLPRIRVTGDFDRSTRLG